MDTHTEKLQELMEAVDGDHVPHSPIRTPTSLSAASPMSPRSPHSQPRSHSPRDGDDGFSDLAGQRFLASSQFEISSLANKSSEVIARSDVVRKLCQVNV